MPFRYMTLHSKETKPYACRARGAAWIVMSVLMLLLTFSSCSKNSEAEDDNAKVTVPVYFTLTIADPVERTSTSAKQSQNFDGDAATLLPTRASDADKWTSDEDREKGTGIDNSIDISSLHIVFYDNAGKRLTQVDNITSAQVTSADPTDSRIYEVYGTLDLATNAFENVNTNTLQGTMVVYVNAGNPVDGWLQPLEDISYRFMYSLSYTGNPSYIPMWGFKKIKLSFDQDNRLNIGDISLLRSMAKITVKLTDDMKNRGYTLDGVTLQKFGDTGFIAPEYDKFIAVNSTDELTMENSFHVDGIYNNKTTVLSFPTSESDKSTTGPLYLLEYENKNKPASDVTTITVRIKHPDGSVRTASFDFGEYVNGNWSNALNIVRNHHYVFSVYGDPIKVNLNVQPWTKFTHDPYKL